jgi:hypothetical protein
MNTCTHTAGLAFRSATKSGGNNTGPNCVEVAPFRKAAKSGAAGHCVMVAHTKATASNPSGNCVEPGVAAADIHADCTPETCLTPGITAGDVVVRDSKLGEDSPLLVFPEDGWRDMVTAVINGAQEIDGEDYLMRDPRNPGLILRFTEAEWDAFRDGCTKDEFTYSELAVSA